MPTIGSTEARTLTRLQEEVLGAVDDNFVKEMGATATAQYIEVVEGLFVPNRRRGVYTLSPSQQASESVPVVLRSHGRFDPTFATLTPGQRTRVMEFIDSESCADLTNSRFVRIRNGAKAPIVETGFSAVISNKNVAGLCTSHALRYCFTDRSEIRIYSRPTILVRAEQEFRPVLTLAHEADHARRRLEAPAVGIRPETEHLERLASELSAYTVQSLVERRCDYPTQSADFVIEARRKYEDCARPFQPTPEMVQHFEDAGKAHLYAQPVTG